MIRFVFIFFFSVLWSLMTACVRLLYRSGIKKPIHLPVRVISIGNFEVGGTGKTPVVAQIARESLERRLSPVILTRGYRGAWERGGGVISPKGVDHSEVDPRLCGDEAALLHELVPGAWIGVGADRVSAFSRAVLRAQECGKIPPNLVILDDGLQHQRIHRDLNMILMTSARPWQKVFRELPNKSRNSRDLLIWTKGASPPFGFGSFSSVIRLRWSLTQAPERGASSSLWLVTGVAESTNVRRLVEQAGWTVAVETVLPDHAHYEKIWVEEVIQKAKSGGLRLATTGKDWIKWRHLGVSRDSILVFEPEIILDDEGRKLWSQRLWQEEV